MIATIMGLNDVLSRPAGLKFALSQFLLPEMPFPPTSPTTANKRQSITNARICYHAFTAINAILLFAARLAGFTPRVAVDARR